MDFIQSKLEEILNWSDLEEVNFDIERIWLVY